MKLKNDSIGSAFLNGVTDRHEFGLHRVENLYRRNLFTHRLWWRLGWEFANVVTTRKLRSPAK